MTARPGGMGSYVGPSENDGAHQYRLDCRAAVDGSTRLLEKLNRAIVRFADRHGIQPEEAKHLLLNCGVRVRA